MRILLRFLSFCSLWLISFAAIAGNTFATQRLQRMASHMTNIPFEKLEKGINNSYTHNGYPINIRVNQWNEVEHIGYTYFTEEQRTVMPSPIYDFIERYTLDLDLPNEISAIERMRIDHFIIEIGSLQDLHKLDTNYSMRVYSSQFKRYRVCWSLEDKQVLSLLFDMDYQVLSGCNAIELESNFLRKARRFKRPADTPLMPLPYELDKCTDNYYIEEGSNYIISAIRNDLFYFKDSTGVWSLLCNSSKPYWSAFNMMLSPDSIGKFTIDVNFDKYGYQTELFTIPACDLVLMAKMMGCTPYFAVKTRTQNSIKGTLFMPNPDQGYCHMLTVEIPIDIMNARKGVIQGRLFVYVPLHNISDHYFEFQNIPHRKRKK